MIIFLSPQRASAPITTISAPRVRANAGNYSVVLPGSCGVISVNVVSGCQLIELLTMFRLNFFRQLVDRQLNRLECFGRFPANAGKTLVGMQKVLHHLQARLSLSLF